MSAGKPRGQGAAGKNHAFCPGRVAGANAADVRKSAAGDFCQSD